MTPADDEDPLTSDQALLVVLVYARGLVVAPRVRLTWSVPVRVPTAVDLFGNPIAWVETDPEVAGQWDPRCWRDQS